MILRENSRHASRCDIRFETEADAAAVVKELEADERVLATEIRLADGRTLGFDKYLEELKARRAGTRARQM
jgi:hypothetical protein